MLIKAQDNRNYRTASRWIKINYTLVTPRHRLYDYSDDGNLCFFRHNNMMYAIGQFERLAYPIMWNDDNGKLQHLSGYDCTSWYNPYLIEIDDGGEYVRLWLEVADNA